MQLCRLRVLYPKSLRASGFLNVAKRASVSQQSTRLYSSNNANGVRKAEHSHQVDSEDFDVYAVSDLHTDFEDNLNWVEALPIQKYKNDVLVVAGDVSDDLRIFRQTMVELVDRFRHVAFVPGNHELWVRGQDDEQEERNQEARDSIEKLHSVLETCRSLGVIVDPCRVGNVWLVPLLAWHHKDFDMEPDIAGIPEVSRMTISDYRACIWPEIGGDRPANGSRAVAVFIDTLNDEQWMEADLEKCDIISFSHFLPSQQLLPEKRFLYYPNVAKAVGSKPLAARIDAIRPNIHIFGHTHFGWDISINGVRYVQCPLCYPAERSRRFQSVVLAKDVNDPRITRSTTKDERGPNEADWLPCLIYSTKKGNSRADREGGVQDGVAELNGEMHFWHASWSEYYAKNDRNPDIVEMAPWVSSRWRRKRRSGVK